MAQTIELTVPDLGGFEDVAIIEVLIASGDTIGKDAPLVTLESDKATMEVPATAAGIVREVKVQIGDRVSAGSVLANVEVADDAVPAAAPASAPTSAVGASDGAVDVAQPASTLEMIVPDIGDFENVPVISVFVKAGDTIVKDAALVELESDKATMEVPALVGGVVRDVLVKVGDKVSQGTVLARVAQAVIPAQSPAKALPSEGAASRSPAVASNDAVDVAEPACIGSATLEMIVPDIGDFENVPVISVFVKAGDTIL